VLRYLRSHEKNEEVREVERVKLHHQSNKTIAPSGFLRHSTMELNISMLERALWTRDRKQNKQKLLSFPLGSATSVLKCSHIMNRVLVIDLHAVYSCSMNPTASLSWCPRALDPMEVAAILDMNMMMQEDMLHVSSEFRHPGECCCTLSLIKKPS
jgi:hypothetical protein